MSDEGKDRIDNCFCFVCKRFKTWQDFGRLGRLRVFQTPNNSSLRKASNFFHLPPPKPTPQTNFCVGPSQPAESESPRPTRLGREGESRRYATRLGQRYAILPTRLGHRFAARLGQRFAARLGQRYAARLGQRIVARLGQRRRFASRIGQRFAARLGQRFAARLGQRRRFAARLGQRFAARLGQRFAARLGQRRRFAARLGQRFAALLGQRFAARLGQRRCVGASRLC